MSITSIVLLFIAAAAIGSTLFVFFVLKDKPRPMLLVLLHGGVALFALSMLTFYTGDNYADHTKRPDVATTIFYIGALGGAYMFIRDKVLKIGIPKWMPVIHAGIGLTALTMLLIFVFGH